MQVFTTMESEKKSDKQFCSKSNAVLASFYVVEPKFPKAYFPEREKGLFNSNLKN